MFLDERRRDEIASRSTVHQDYGRVTVNEASKLDKVTLSGKLVNLHRGDGWRRRIFLLQNG